MSLPLMFFIQLGRGLTPTESALLLMPMAVAVGRARALRRHAGSTAPIPRVLLVPGLLLVAGSLVLYSSLMNLDTPIWMFLHPLGHHGHRKRRHVGAAGDDRDAQPPAPAGGRRRRHLQHDSHDRLGDRLGRHRRVHAEPARGEHPGCGRMPRAASAADSFRLAIAEQFSTAMSQAILLPAAVMLIGVVAVLFLRRPTPMATRGLAGCRSRGLTEAPAEPKNSGDAPPIGRASPECGAPAASPTR